ncbi:MAG: PaaI family thioesterase [Acidimicrobiales bacterium]
MNEASPSSVAGAVLSATELQDFLAAAFPDAPPPMIVEEVADWGVRIRLRVTGMHSRPGGTVSGPALMALADTAAWAAVIARIGPVALAVTTSLHIDFLRKPPLLDVVAEGRLLKLGRRLGVTDVSLWSAGSGSGDLVAKAQVTYSIPPTGLSPEA